MKYANKRAHESLEFELAKAMDTFSLNTPLELEQRKWMISLASLEVINSFLK